MSPATRDATPPEAQAPARCRAASRRPRLRLHTARGRWVIAASVLGAGIVFIDGTVVNVALPAIGRTFHSSLATLQWTVTAYTLTLASFILVGGSIGDHYGRRRSFMVGVLWFAAASLVCGLAPNSPCSSGARPAGGRRRAAHPGEPRHPAGDSFARRIAPRRSARGRA